MVVGIIFLVLFASLLFVTWYDTIASNLGMRAFSSNPFIVLGKHFERSNELRKIQAQVAFERSVAEFFANYNEGRCGSTQARMQLESFFSSTFKLEYEAARKREQAEAKNGRGL